MLSPSRHLPAQTATDFPTHRARSDFFTPVVWPCPLSAPHRRAPSPPPPPPTPLLRTHRSCWPPLTPAASPHGLHHHPGVGCSFHAPDCGTRLPCLPPLLSLAGVPVHSAATVSQLKSLPLRVRPSPVRAKTKARATAIPHPAVPLPSGVCPSTPSEGAHPVST